MHQRVRKEFWGYASDETLSNADLISEKYRGIRPAPGYPAQPDHTEKATLFSLLEAEGRIGVKLTESYAMWPGAAVCGLYFSHPDAHYFGVGKIERDQVEDYARRKAVVHAGMRTVAGAHPQLRSAGGGAHGSGVRRASCPGRRPKARSRASLTRHGESRDPGAKYSLQDGSRLAPSARPGHGVRSLFTAARFCVRLGCTR